MNAALLLLADGRFPAGGHTYSAGVEAAVALGDAVDESSLERYLAERLATTGRTDAAFAAHVAGNEPSSDDLPAWLALLDAEYEARIPSPHLRATSRLLGRQLLRAGRVTWASVLLDRLATHARGAHQPIVLAALTVAAGGTPADAATISLHHLASAVTTAAVRLRGLDPMTVAAIQARAVDVAQPGADTVSSWVSVDPADLPAEGGALTEILGEDHGAWDARLFVA